jgi:O-methyltransferase involved in polyketide biosynthesis
MKERDASPSAENVAAIRAGWSMRPEEERVCYDPLAKDFLGAEFTNLIMIHSCSRRQLRLPKKEPLVQLDV